MVLVGPERDGVSTVPPPPRDIAPSVAMDRSAFRLNLDVTDIDRLGVLGVLDVLGVRGVLGVLGFVGVIVLY